MSNTFTDLLHTAKAAFKRKDCAAARDATRRMLVVANTPAQRETVVRLQNAVRRCKVPALAGSRRRSAGRRRSGRLGATTVNSADVAELRETWAGSDAELSKTAQRIQDAANRLAREGRGFSGGKRVFLADVAQELGTKVKYIAPILILANRQALLTLARADLTGAMDAKKVSDSEIKYLNSSFNFIQAK